MTETSLSINAPDVIVGTIICQRTSFILDKFLSNQQEIQKAYPGCTLVIATDDLDFIAELKEQINGYDLNGESITYEAVKPDHARSRAWSIAYGKDELRKYVLSMGVEYFLSLDSDMVYEPSVISIMKDKIQGYDVVSSGYQLPRWGGWGFGTGCIMLNKNILSKITFRCYEFQNGRVISEDAVLDMDLFSSHARINKGIFVSIKHYVNSQEYYAIEPQPMGWFRTVTNNPLVRYILIRMSILTRYQIAYKLHELLYKTCHILG